MASQYITIVFEPKMWPTSVCTVGGIVSGVYEHNIKLRREKKIIQTIMWVSDKRTAYIKEGQVQEYGTLGAASRSRRIVYVAVDPKTSYSV